MCDEKKVYYLEDGGFVVMWNDKRGELKVNWNRIMNDIKNSYLEN